MKTHATREGNLWRVYITSLQGIHLSCLLASEDEPPECRILALYDQYPHLFMPEEERLARKAGRW